MTSVFISGLLGAPRNHPMTKKWELMICWDSRYKILLLNLIKRYLSCWQTPSRGSSTCSDAIVGWWAIILYPTWTYWWSFSLFILKHTDESIGLYMKDWEKMWHKDAFICGEVVFLLVKGLVTNTKSVIIN